MGTTASRLRTKWRTWLRCGVLAVALLPGLVSAAISMNRTRLILTQQARETSVQIHNAGARPMFIQTWVDTGDAQDQIESIQTPFIVNPPVFQLNPGQSKHVRVLMVWPVENLPSERESVFWFNVLEFPPPATSEIDGASNHLQIRFHTRLKIFFRPDRVAGHVSPVAERLAFTLKQDASGNASLHIHNPSPLHWSPGIVAVIAPDGTEIRLPAHMVGPGQTVEHSLNRSTTGAGLSAHWRVRFSTIDDFGVAHHEEKPLLPE